MTRERRFLRRTLGGVLTATVVAGGAAVLAQERTVADGVYTAEQAERGRMAYAAFCAHCHAGDLSGDNSGDVGAPPLRRDGFRAGSTVLALFTKISETMPLDARGALSPEQSLDIVAYVLQQNGFPAGDRELSTVPDTIGGIRIVAASELPR